MTNPMKSYVNRINEIKTDLNDIHKLLCAARNNRDYDALMDKRKDLMYELRHVAFDPTNSASISISLNEPYLSYLDIYCK